MMSKEDTKASATLILQHLSTAAIPMDVQVVAETGSTNTDLLEVLQDLTQPTCRIAELQTSGRGRAGRQWRTLPDTSLTFSVAWPMLRKNQALSGLTLAIGVCMVDALRALGVPTDLKWPNDILRDGAKLVGILVESAKQISTSTTWVVVGVGINMNIPVAFETALDRTIANAPELAAMDRNVLFAKLLAHIAQALVQFDQHGFVPFMARWNQYHAYGDQPVVLMHQGEIKAEGIAKGIDEEGRFLMQTSSGITRVAVGDISLRLQKEVKGKHAITH